MPRLHLARQTIFINIRLHCLPSVVGVEWGPSLSVPDADPQVLDDLMRPDDDEDLACLDRVPRC